VLRRTDVFAFCSAVCWGMRNTNFTAKSVDSQAPERENFRIVPNFETASLTRKTARNLAFSVVRNAVGNVWLVTVWSWRRDLNPRPQPWQGSISGSVDQQKLTSPGQARLVPLASSA
jgi:hypothetical protein